MELDPIPTMLEAVVVDARPEVRTLTVKDVMDHETWMVSLAEDARIFGPGKPEIRLEEVEIGTRVRISGTSRVELILRAEQIEVLAGSRQP